MKREELEREKRTSTSVCSATSKVKCSVCDNRSSLSAKKTETISKKTRKNKKPIYRLKRTKSNSTVPPVKPLTNNKT